MLSEKYLFLGERFSPYFWGQASLPGGEHHAGIAMLRSAIVLRFCTMPAR
jgi:hypothetical protein